MSDSIEEEVRKLAYSLPPSDLASTRAIQVVAEFVRSKFSASEAREAHAKETMAGVALKYADALQKIAEAEARAGNAEALLNDLFEMVWGECPSLLRDHHLDDKIRAAIKEHSNG